MFNGFGTWDCQKFGSPKTCFTREPYELQVYPNKRYRLRIINTAAHGTFSPLEPGLQLTWVAAMIYNSVDGHTLDVIEADDTGVSSPEATGRHRVKSHNGQRYSALLKTDQGKAGDVFWMRAELHPSCFPYLTPEVTNTTLAILRYVDEKPYVKPTKHLPTTRDWKDSLGDDCKDIESSALVPIMRQDPPVHVSQQGIFNTRVGRLDTSDGPVTRFFMNNVTFNHLWYRPVLYDVVEGRDVNNSNIMSMTFDEPQGADIIINNLDPFVHPYHCRYCDVVVIGANL